MRLMKTMFWFSEWNKEQSEQRIYSMFDDDDVYILNGNGSYNLWNKTAVKKEHWIKIN